MRSLSILSGLFLFSVLCSCSKEISSKVIDTTTATTSDSEAFSNSGVIVVRVSDSFLRELENGNCTSFDGFTFERAIPQDDEFEQRHRAAGLHKWYYAKADGELQATKAAPLLKSSPLIEKIEILPRTEPAGIPFNDPFAINQWHLFNEGNIVPGASYGADINVIPVWEEFTTGSKDVIVAVIDTGVQSNHPDLQGVVIPAGENGSRSFLNSTASHPYNYTPQRHGTHVAGIIAAINNNGTGICGIAGGNDGTGGVKILDLQAIRTDETDGGDVLSAAVWAADHGAVIANNSWNNVYDSENQVPDNLDSFSAAVIDYFINNAGTDSKGNQVGPMKGGVVFFSAGNNSWAKAQPAMYEKVIAVGATGPAGEASSYTNYGDWVDLCAPGGNYTPYANTSAQLYSTVSGSGYAWMQGTSMSCPVVSGVAALLVSKFGGPGFTNKDLLDMLLGGSDKETVSKHSKRIGSKVDAYESFTFKNKTAEPTDAPTVNVKGSTATVTWKTKKYGDGPYHAYSVIIGESMAEVQDADPFNLSSRIRSRTASVGGRVPGSELSSIFYQLEKGKDYYCTAIGYSKSHKYSTGNKITKFRLNSPPALTIVSGSDITIRHFETTEVILTYSDPDGDKLSFTLDPGSTAGSWSNDGEGKLTLRIDGSAAPAGDYNASAEVRDAESKASVNIKYTILQNRSVVISSKIEDLLIKTGSSIFTLDSYFSDPDGDAIVYTAVSSSQDLKASVNGSVLMLSCSVPGIATISVSASDGNSEPVSQSFRIRCYSDPRADVFPSRVSDFLKIAVSNEGSINIKIFNSTGKKVSEEDIILSTFDIHTIDLSSCAPGIYIVKITGSGNDSTHKIVKI